MTALNQEQRQALSAIAPIPLPEVHSQRGVLYLRLSEDELARGEDPDPEAIRRALDRQRKPALRLAKKRGIEIVGEYVDIDKSAYDLDKIRPDFERLLRDAPFDAFDFVLIWGSDRLYRRMRDLTRITDELARHVRILATQEQEIDLETAAGILNAQILGAIGEFEQRRKGERLKARAEQRAKDEGRMISAIRPIGWQWAQPCPAGDACEHRRPCKEAGRRPRFGSRSGLIPHPIEAPILARCYREIADGKSLRSLMPLWAELPVVTRPPTLRLAMLSPRHAGLVSLGGHKNVVAEAADGQRIVPVDLWQEVRAKLEDPTRTKRPGRPAKTYLSGILRCGVCEGPMNATNLSGKGRKGQLYKYPAYVCGRSRCMTRQRPPIDEAVLDLVGEWISRDAEELLSRAAPTAGPAQAAAAQEVRELHERLATYNELAAKGQIPPEDHAATTTIIRADLIAAQERAVVAVGKPATARLLRSADPRAAFEEIRGDVEAIRPVLLELFEGIIHSKEIRGEGALVVRWQAWAR